MACNLNLPQSYVPRRVVGNPRAVAGQRIVLAELEGPGCIRRIWMTLRPLPMHNRRVILRIYWDDELEPSVEAPIGDFFGLVHGIPHYPIDTPYLAVSGQCGVTSYFPMPFAERARIEVESAEISDSVFYHVDWQQYAEASLQEPLRFHAQWRREFPTQAFGEEYLVLDAVGRGELVGFTYGVRLYDDAARWSHGGADNIYVDGQGEPAFLRGSGGEDTFGVSGGGVLHTPDSHMYQGMPYYVHEDIGEPKAVQRLAGYRFFVHDTIPFAQHLHFRFGCVANDICSTAYWYQEEPHRPFFRMPPWPQMEPGVELKRGICDLPLASTGSWWLCGAFEDADGQGMTSQLPCEDEFDPEATYDGCFSKDSPWALQSWIKPDQGVARWAMREEIGGFTDFNWVYRPHDRRVSVCWPAVAYALTWLESPMACEVTMLLAWDDDLELRVNDQVALPCTNHSLFSKQQVKARLKEGINKLSVKLNNRKSQTWGAWCFAFAARLPDGTILRPSASLGGTRRYE